MPRTTGIAARLQARFSMRYALFFMAALGAAACSSQPAAPAAEAPPAAARTADPEHQNLTAPHGDHSPHKGGMVLMNGDMHYEVVFSRDGAHRIWFSDPVRAELPASVATGVTMVITRDKEAPEILKLEIDDTGESWLAHGRPVVGEGTYVKISYALQGEPHEVELPFVIQAPPTP
jgi:hypothetical protein